MATDAADVTPTPAAEPDVVIELGPVADDGTVVVEVLRGDDSVRAAVTPGDPSSWWPVAFHAETAFDMPGMIVLRRLREEFACSDPPGSRRMDPQETPARHDWLSSAMELRRIAAELEALARS